MKRQLSFSSKSSVTRITRSLVFYFSIPSSIIFLTFVIIWVNKTAPPNSVPVQETSRCLRFNTTSSPIPSFMAAVVPPVPSSVETNLTTGNSSSSISAVTSDDGPPPKDSTLKLAATPSSAPENASSFSGTNSLVSGLQRKENETDDRGDGELDGKELTTEEQSAAAVTEEQNITPWNKTEEQNAPLTNEVQGKNVPLTSETEEQNVPLLNETEEINAALSEKKIEEQQWPLMNETEGQNVPFLNEVEEQSAPLRNETAEQNVQLLNKTEEKNATLSENKIEEQQWPLMKEAEEKNAPLLNKTEGNSNPLMNETEEKNAPSLNETEDQNAELSENKIEEQQWPVMKENEEQHAPLLNEFEEKIAALSENKFIVQDAPLMNETKEKNAPLLNKTEGNNAPLMNETGEQNAPLLNETEEQNAALSENKIEEKQWPAVKEIEEQNSPLLNEVEEKNAVLSENKIEEQDTPLMKRTEKQQNAPLMNETEDRIEADKSRKRLAGKKRKKKKTRTTSVDQTSQISSSGGLLVEEDMSITKLGGSCDLSTKGRWVKDNSSYPLYTYRSCPFIEKGFNCEGNGRLDRDFMKWRWQPEDCDIPRFNARKMLELMRGKRLVFVGDSLNRNQCQSMVCMLMGAIRGLRVTRGKGAYTFTFVDYKCTVEFYTSPFLVDKGMARVGQKQVQTLRIDAIDRASSRWRGADMLVFDTGHWWNDHKTNAGINFYQEGGKIHPYLDISTAIRKAMMTWASWVDKNINPRKTRVFFRSLSPTHFRGGQWNTGGSCAEATEPLLQPWRIADERNIIAEQVVKQMKTRVTLLNITGLSEYRIDGHPSVYGNRHTSGVQDCSHWCLPGIPDVWNELLYLHLLQ